MREGVPVRELLTSVFDALLDHVEVLEERGEFLVARECELVDVLREVVHLVLDAVDFLLQQRILHATTHD